MSMLFTIGLDASGPFLAVLVGSSHPHTANTSKLIHIALIADSIMVDEQQQRVSE